MALDGAFLFAGVNVEPLLGFGTAFFGAMPLALQEFTTCLLKPLVATSIQFIDYGTSRPSF
eukprot:3571832-Amphidinium_carterae.1